MLQPGLLDAFLEKHRLPASYGAMAQEYFVPLADWLHRRRGAYNCLLLGLNGAQGTGKSTLADFIRVAANEMYGWNVAVLSLDDFYLTRAERKVLARELHPLFATRGVPGTHDTALLETSLAALPGLGESEKYAVPSFDKSLDDRSESPWPTISGPVDMIILEGWCIGTPPQAMGDLADPVNILEREEDPNGEWRTAVNECLETDYAGIFRRLDALVFLRAPSFEAVFEWRLEQEQKLTDRVGADAPGLMNAAELRRFTAFYERLTRHGLDTLDELADVVLALDNDHTVRSCRYRTGS
jgi:D-glycerate 3-kinase